MSELKLASLDEIFKELRLRGGAQGSYFPKLNFNGEELHSVDVYRLKVDKDTVVVMRGTLDTNG